MATKIKTQRAWIAQDGVSPENYDLDWLIHLPYADPKTDLPVLIVPEDTVKGCKHPEATQEGMSSRFAQLAVCSLCGAWKWNNQRWQRPRILRVGRVKK